MALALMTLTLVSLMIAAAFVAAKGDINNSSSTSDGKRAFYAARAGLNTFLYKLNKNTELWQTCPSQATTDRARGTTTPDVLLPADRREREHARAARPTRSTR